MLNPKWTAILLNIERHYKKFFRPLVRVIKAEKPLKLIILNLVAIPRKERKLLRSFLILLLRRKRIIFTSDHKCQPRKSPSKTTRMRNEMTKLTPFSKIAVIMLFLK